MRHGLDKGEARSHSPFGVVLIGDGVAEVDQHTVAHVARDEPAEPGDVFGDAAMVSRHDVAKVLRIETRPEGS